MYVLDTPCTARLVRRLKSALCGWGPCDRDREQRLRREAMCRRCLKCCVPDGSFVAGLPAHRGAQGAQRTQNAQRTLPTGAQIGTPLALNARLYGTPSNTEKSAHTTTASAQAPSQPAPARDTSLSISPHPTTRPQALNTGQLSHQQPFRNNEAPPTARIFVIPPSAADFRYTTPQMQRSFIPSAQSGFTNLAFPSRQQSPRSDALA